MKLALITGLEMPTADLETPLLLDALAELGITGDVLAWRGSEVAWESYDLIVLRTPWDYSFHAGEWREWIRARQRTLENPAGVVAWTGHKGYLTDLQRAGVPVIPTTLLQAGAPPEAIRAAALAAAGGSDRYDVVVKPAVGAGGRGMERVDSPDRAIAHAERLLRSGDAVLQPFQAEVLSGGEVSIICFDGRYSHAVRKRAGGADFRIHARYGGTVEPHTSSDAELRVAEAAIACAPEPTLYARVDLIGSREPRVGELELVEPELFLRCDPGAAARFAVAIRDRLRAVELSRRGR